MPIRTLFVTLILLCTMCREKAGPDQPPLSIDIKKLKIQVEANTNPFDPSFFKQKHEALIYRIKNGKILDSLSLTSLVEKVGTMPVIKKQGTFKVTYKDTTGIVLGSYTMPSPLFMRIEAGNHVEVRKVDHGYFQVPLPRDPKIGTVILEDKGMPMIVSDVRKLFQNL